MAANVRAEEARRIAVLIEPLAKPMQVLEHAVERMIRRDPGAAPQADHLFRQDRLQGGEPFNLLVLTSLLNFASPPQNVSCSPLQEERLHSRPSRDGYQRGSVPRAVSVRDDRDIRPSRGSVRRRRIGGKGARRSWDRSRASLSANTLRAIVSSIKVLRPSPE